MTDNTRDKLATFIAWLEENEFDDVLEKIKLLKWEHIGNLSEENWEKIAGVAVGIVIFNELQKMRPRDVSLEGSMMIDGVDVNSATVVKRTSLVDEIILLACTHRRVVLASPPGTGKTSLLNLLQNKLCHERVFKLTPRGGHESMKEKLERSLECSFCDLDALEKVRPCWIMVDDAQIGYTDEYDYIWQFLVKDLPRNIDVKVVFAATHDITTLGSPVVFSMLKHVFKNFTLAEVDEYVEKCSNVYEFPVEKEWDAYWHEVKALSEMTAESTPSFHIGVIMLCVLKLCKSKGEESRTEGGLQLASEIEKLASQAFIIDMKRCFSVDKRLMESPDTRKLLTDTVLKNSTGCELPLSLQPLVRGGVLTSTGSFSCRAAHWLYYQSFFPDRATSCPKTLAELIRTAVPLLSTKRLEEKVRDRTRNNPNLPIENVFQHLLGEAMNICMPAICAVKPEYQTKKRNAQGEKKSGRLDFYINHNIQWGVELLINGDRLQEHLDRFSLNGKYSAIPMKSFLIVDIRGPEVQQLPPQLGLCRLFFSEDYNTCSIQMEMDLNQTVVTLAC